MNTYVISSPFKKVAPLTYFELNIFYNDLLIMKHPNYWKTEKLHVQWSFLPLVTTAGCKATNRSCVCRSVTHGFAESGLSQKYMCVYTHIHTHIYMEYLYIFKEWFQFVLMIQFLLLLLEPKYSCVWDMNLAISIHFSKSRQI